MSTPDPMTGLMEQVILQLPNFIGLVLSLLVVLRQNIKLTDTLVQLTKDCDCQEKPPVIQLVENQHDQQPPS